MPSVKDWIAYLEMLQEQGFKSYEVYFERSSCSRSDRSGSFSA
jgi:hypothetical protein